MKYLIKAKKRCRQLIKDFNPDIVIGGGGYVTVPVITQAKKLGYKVFIHEQNSVPGRANQYLSHYADKVGVSFPGSKDYFPKDKVVVTGNPCSENAIKVKACDKKEFGLSNNKPLILFVMGSSGASKVNDFLIKTMSLFNNKDYEILYVTGKDDYGRISKLTFPKNVKVVPYIEKMTRIMKQTDIMVTRAGASTLSEIIALEIPSIVIPSPYVPNNHQYKNAMDLVNNNAAFLVEEKDLKGDILVRCVDSLLMDVNKLDSMKRHLREMQVDNSATVIYETIHTLIDRK